MKKKNKPCPICGYINIEKITLKKRLFKIGKLMFLAFLLTTSLLGTTAVYNFMVGGIYSEPDLMISIGGFYSFVTNNFLSIFQSDSDKEELKKIALDLTKDCETDYCKAKKIYKHLIEFDYEVGTNTNPLEIYFEGEGDCDEISYLFKSLLDSISINSMLQCNERHCWDIVKLEDMNILVDIIQEKWEVY